MEGGRDNSVHAEINDIAFVPAYREGKLGFNVLVGGFFSAKRCEAAIPLDAWVSPNDDVVDLSRAILEVFRDHGLSANRTKSRLMWLIDGWGIEPISDQGGGGPMADRCQPLPWKTKSTGTSGSHIGLYPQQQPGLYYAGLHVPVGRLTAEDMFDLAQIAEVYGSGEIRLTVEQNVIIPHIPDFPAGAAGSRKPLLQRFSLDPNPLERLLVSCTGAQFCNFALIETKQRAVALIRELETELSLTRPVRIHWTGCPNSCGQPQVADIGLMGTKVRKDGKTVEGVDIYNGRQSRERCPAR